MESIPLKNQNMPPSYDQKSADVPTRTKNKYFLVEPGLKNLPTKAKNSHILVEHRRQISSDESQEFSHLSGALLQISSDESQEFSHLGGAQHLQIAPSLIIPTTKRQHCPLTTNNALQPPPTAAYPQAGPAFHA